jgi:hypothetical protein
LENTEHAIQRPIDFLDALMIEGLRDDARDTGVDNSSRAAGLANQDISYEFFSHGSVVFEKGWKQREG